MNATSAHDNMFPHGKIPRSVAVSKVLELAQELGSRDAFVESASVVVYGGNGGLVTGTACSLRAGEGVRNSSSSPRNRGLLVIHGYQLSRSRVLTPRGGNGRLETRWVASIEGAK